MNNPGRTSTSHPEEQRQSESGAGVLESVKDTAQKAWEGTKDVASRAVEGTKDLAGRAWEGTKSAAGAVSHSVGRGVESVSGMVRSYPLASILIAVGTGFLIGQALCLTNRS
jgi:hypothetical protein